MTGTHALVALKHNAGAKSRLSGVLGPAERAALVRAMCRDVLACLRAHPAIDSVALVSRGDDARDLAQLCGVDFIDEAQLGADDLNTALQAAAAQRAGAGRLLALHADLPALGAADIDAVLAAPAQALVIGADKTGRGTNLLAFPGAAVPQFQFGADSCARHSAAAQGAGLEPALLSRPGLALDIDEPADLECLPGAPAVGAYTRRCLSALGLGTGSLAREDALALADDDDLAGLLALAGAARDRGHGALVTYSRKVFIPLTQLCRDVCHYCTFAQTPKRVEQPFMPVEEVLELCRAGAAMGCQEALFTLGERPELRYSAARKALAAMGYASTLEYLRDVAARVLEETGLLPHINAGCMSDEEIALLRPVSASMGIMLESAAERLCEKGMPHYGSPDKQPAVRLATIERAGQAAVPFTSGILIGIGETRRERVESLLALREAHERHGHLQEVIVQNFRAKPGTLMAAAPEPDLEELLWTIAAARVVFGPAMNIQAPPNLSPGVLERLVEAGINDWGGVSPLTPDHVNPEAPWPHLEQLARETAAAGKFLEQRLTIYPEYAEQAARWLDPALRGPVLAHSDAAGFARRDRWVPGEDIAVPELERALLASPPADAAVPADLRAIVERCESGAALEQADVERLFAVRGPEFSWVAAQADRLRQQAVGERVTYAVNRNINYTNVCYFKCQFCAFSKGKLSENLRGRPYDISGEEIARRCREAWERGATEVCMQGGIHPDYTGQTYLDILRTVRAATPQMHIHAFSPLEVWQGAQTLDMPLPEFLRELREAGLDTLPGTAAEVLDDEVRSVLCPDKLDTAQWLAVIEEAHRAGLRTTATIMYGHIEAPRHWARHLLALRELQARTGGFTEFVPLPFVHMEAPLYLKGRARRGPSFREALLMHSVARLVFHGFIENIQASWVKMGEAGVSACLEAGANDLGGTLMNESITRAAGSSHGQEWPPAHMEALARRLGREPMMRTTAYAPAPAERRLAAFNAAPLAAPENQSAGKLQRDKLIPVTALADRPSPALFTQVMPMAACD
ncbi:7,8-didemethyl-8-hydroxy-5-deazariboflavin synthase subunit CofH [Mangrovimicrobium sediminis]|uniref:3-phospho-D-glycerate guanylyltransferase n=1 Tax=Mangrovimicrobium sediminis TaxID=2562682 RepID=A0A4Z0M4Y6_9GAMM|nr:5-amino-6-(D-ribitylamino)uracil--L-tyrosine 4-hydroxyphenyl transferase CofH [Haliea sp. SAOS-164]TGD74569.1 7,8-didemethyl-8-hydroxy-5-deazariboflavin synthase subunit CofH [Haliea sp. SAOS-164]